MRGPTLATWPQARGDRLGRDAVGTPTSVSGRRDGHPRWGRARSARTGGHRRLRRRTRRHSTTTRTHRARRTGSGGARSRRSERWRAGPGELSQQPTWPQIMHIRRCTHRPPVRRHSSQPSAEGPTAATWSRWLQNSSASVTASPPTIGSPPTIRGATGSPGRPARLGLRRWYRRPGSPGTPRSTGPDRTHHGGWRATGQGGPVCEVSSRLTRVRRVRSSGLRDGTPPRHGRTRSARSGNGSGPCRTPTSR